MWIASIRVFIGVIGSITAAIIIGRNIATVAIVIVIMIVVVGIKALPITRYYATRKKPSTRQMTRMIGAHHGECCISTSNS